MARARAEDAALVKRRKEALVAERLAHQARTTRRGAAQQRRAREDALLALADKRAREMAQLAAARSLGQSRRRQVRPVPGV